MTLEKRMQKLLKLCRKKLKKTLTYALGKEMSEHEQFTIDTGIHVFFAHPGSSPGKGNK